MWGRGKGSVSAAESEPHVAERKRIGTGFGPDSEKQRMLRELPKR
jgi:hypothetical protein